MKRLSSEHNLRGGRIFNPGIHVLHSILDDNSFYQVRNLTMTEEKLLFVLDHKDGFPLTIEYDIEHIRTMWHSDRERLQNWIDSWFPNNLINTKR